MKKLIVKIFILVILIIIILTPISFLSSQYLHQALNAEVFNFGEEIDILILGDSHAEVAVNPSLLPHSANISLSCENYFYSYYKLCHFIDKNPQVNTVVLAFSWHNFAKEYQESALFGIIGKNVDYFFPLLNQSGKDLIKSWNSTYVVPWIRNTIGLPLQIYKDRLLQKQFLGLQLKREDFNFFGGYTSMEISKVDEENINKKIKLYYNRLNNSEYHISEYMIEYIERILVLCSQHNIRVILFNSPVYEKYLDGVPRKAFYDLDSLQNYLISKFNNVKYIDGSNLRLPSDCYYDGDHLNSKGSATFTEYLAIELAKRDI